MAAPTGYRASTLDIRRLSLFLAVVEKIAALAAAQGAVTVPCDPPLMRDLVIVHRTGSPTPTAVAFLAVAARSHGDQHGDAAGRGVDGDHEQRRADRRRPVEAERARARGRPRSRWPELALVSKQLRRVVAATRSFTIGTGPACADEACDAVSRGAVTGHD